MIRPVDWSPLAGEDPVPGDAWEVALLARRYRDTARAIADQTAQLSRMGLDAPATWDGDAGRVFAEHATTLAHDLGRAEQRYAVASTALAEWGPVLEETQARADAVLATAKDAEARRLANALHGADAASPFGPSGPLGPLGGMNAIVPLGLDTAERARRQVVDEAEAAVAAARRQLESIVDDYRASAARLAHRIKDAAGDDGLKDSRWDRFKNFVSDHAGVLKFISGVASSISLAATVASLALGWVPVLGQALVTVATVSLAVTLVADTLLAMAGEGSWAVVGVEIVGLGMFGAARLAQGPIAATQSAVAAERTAIASTVGLPTRAQAAQLLRDAKPVGSAMKADRWHRSGSFVLDDVAEHGTVFRTTGGDGVPRVLIQLRGEVDGIAGRFEWILDGGNLTHQMFVRGGTINGVPIKP